MPIKARRELIAAAIRLADEMYVTLPSVPTALSSCNQQSMWKTDDPSAWTLFIFEFGQLQDRGQSRSLSRGALVSVYLV